MGKLLRDETFERALNKHNALMEVSVAQALEELQNDWAGLKNLAESGLFGQAYGIGTQFTDNWSDGTTQYAYPMQLNHIGDVELEDGETLEDRPYLQAHYAHPFGVQFCHQRAITAAMHKVETALTSGTTYCWLRQSDGKYISFKAPSAIAAGQWLGYQNGLIEIYDSYGNKIGSTAATEGNSASGTSLGDAPVIEAGEYYFTFAASWGNNVVANEVVSFTLPEDLQFGERICGCYGAPDQARTNWKVYPVTDDGKTLGTAIPVSNSAEGTNLGVMYTNYRNTSGSLILNSIQEVAYGRNRWRDSAIRQFLNSAGAVNTWWKATDAFDVRPDELTTKRGWLAGWDEDFVNALKTVKVVTYPNTVQEDTGGNTPDITYDRVFLPSLEEIFCVPQKAGEGEYHEYWKRKSGASSPLAAGSTYPQMITYAVENHTSAQYVRLRSAYRGFAYVAWFVSASGYVGGYGYASYSYRFAPLVVL